MNDKVDSMKMLNHLCCHSRSNLEILALLEILQSCKFDHEVAWLCNRNHPPTHPANPQPSLKIIVQWNVGSWNLLGVCLEGTKNVPGMCLEGVWFVRAYRCTKKVSENLQHSLEPSIFWGLAFFWIQNLANQTYFTPSQVRTGQVRTGQVRTIPVRTGQLRNVKSVVKLEQVNHRTGYVRTGQVRLRQIKSSHVWSSPVILVKAI